MNLSEIANIRLQTQQISATEFKTPKDLVAWMGAMQAQDYAMAKWAIGKRVLNASDHSVEDAIDKGEIIRTHVLRPTWHFVSPEDIYWMLELTAPQIRTATKSRDKQLGLTEKIYLKCNSIIEKSLGKNKNMTRDELMAELEKNKINTLEYRSGHIMLRAELDGIACSGATKNKKQTYALLPERIPKRKKITREEALAKLAQRYFMSHGPATLQDFIWWSGLKTKDAKDALEMAKQDLVQEKSGAETFWLSNSFSKMGTGNSSVHLLPAFDEFLISYKNREASLSPVKQKKAFSSNGIFWPTIVVDGKVTGLWKRAFKSGKVIIETEFFQAHNKSQRLQLEKEVKRFGAFLDKKTESILK